MSFIESVTDDTFEEHVLQSDLPVLVDFWAQWCAPCKMIAPILEDIALEYQGKLKIYKIDVDQHKSIPATYAIRGIPTLMIFKGGEIVATKSGMMTKTQLADFVESGL